MNIGQLIASLERRSELSDEGHLTEVKLHLHVAEYNSSGYCIETTIEDVSNVWGGGKDECLIETVLNTKDLQRLQELNRIAN